MQIVGPKWKPRFGSHQNFLDPQFDENGDPYGPIRFRELAKECYLISKNMNTSYSDILLITPTERKYLIKFLIDEAKQQQEMIEKRRAEAAANR